MIAMKLAKIAISAVLLVTVSAQGFQGLPKCAVSPDLAVKSQQASLDVHMLT
jgi:hypothetical protein